MCCVYGCGYGLYTGYFGWLANNNSKWLAAFSSLSPLIKFNYLMTVEMWIKNK